LLDIIEASDESRISDILNDVDARMDMAPECTGFMVRASQSNLTVEPRSGPTSRFLTHSFSFIADFYSFGCILYRLACGRPVFRIAENMDLIYVHVAVEPKSPSSRGHHVPEPLCDIIMKLLKKGAEDRYQSAHGIQADIEELLRRWTARLPLDSLPFIPGETDRPALFITPTHIVGRTHELGVIRETCEAASRKGGGLHVVMLKGKHGTGKTKIIMEVKKLACAKRALFGSAKFDVYRRDLPFYGYVTVLRALVNVTSAVVRSDSSKSNPARKEQYASGKSKSAI
jgi:AAA ATPase domain